jgi:putative membrane protein
MVFPLLIAFLLSLVALIFAFQNATPATIAFLAWRFESTLAVVLVLAFTAGLTAGVLMVLPARIRSGLAGASRKRELGAVEARLAECQAKLEEAEARLAAADSAGPPGAAGSQPAS